MKTKSHSTSKAQSVKSKGPLILMVAGGALVILVAIWQLAQLPTSTASATQSSSAFQIPYPEIERVSLNDAKAAFDQQSAVFLDVRDASSYNQGHIQGSINISLIDLESHLSDIPKDRWIITVCT